MSGRYRVTRADRASRPIFAVGDIVYPGRDCYGCANEDTRNFGLEYRAVSVSESGEPFYTIPAADIELLTDEDDVCETCKGRRFHSRPVGNIDADDQPCPDCNPKGEGVAP